MSIPVIDIGPYLTAGGMSTQPAGRRGFAKDVVAQWAHCFETVGFAQITGFDPALWTAGDAAYSELRAFFELPKAEKMRCSLPLGRGFNAVGAESVASTLDTDGDGDAPPPDLVESISFPQLHRSKIPGWGPAHTDDKEAHPIPWPEEPRKLQPACEAYYEHCAKLTHRLMQLSAEALGLPAEHFEPYYTQQVFSLRAAFYPHQPADNGAAAGQTRYGYHNDYTGLTLLRQDSQYRGCGGGLEVSVDGQAVPVEPVPGALVVNCGELTSRWTNNKWKAARHRVSNPRPPTTEDDDNSRLSLVFFTGPNSASTITCLPGCEGPNGPQYPPITAEAQIRQKLERSRADGSAWAEKDSL
jgi:isopenicillin N synthase-like dioxygenase